MTLNPADFTAANTAPRQFEDPERHRIAMREAIETVILTGENGQKFSGLHLNRDFTDQPAIVRLGGWFEDVEGDGLKYTAYQYAAYNPENPVILIDMPAHGQSDSLTAPQRRQIVRTGKVSGVASSQALAASSRLEESEDVVVVGESAGGMLASTFAIKMGKLGLKPLAIVGFEIAGVDKRPSLGLAASFLIDGHFMQRMYHKGPDNKRLDRAYELDFRQELARLGGESRSSSLMRIFRVEPTYMGFLVVRDPLASDGSFEDIEQAMDLNPDMKAAFVSGSLSRIGRWKKIEPQVDRLLLYYPGRLSWQTWLNDNHSMGIAAQQPRQAKYTRAVIDSILA